ncbi:MAG: tetratricopeptide repeat protein [Lewinellaceae bacterium]|nr:tetratricopeptide repeat protein [Lewinellaceae bacterium]
MSKRKTAKSRPPVQQSKKQQPETKKPASPAHRQIPGAWVVGAVAAVLGFVLYYNTLGHGYCLDDFSSIKENWVVKGGLKNLGLIFSKEYRYGSWNSPGSLYRPLALTVFAIQWQLSPDNPYVGHLVNILAYAFTGWLLWVTWRRILVKYPPVLTALAVLLFIAHPVHTEVVANIKSLDEIMSLMFCTLSLYGIWRYLERDSSPWLVLSVISYGLGIFSKESAITFLAIVPLTLWFFGDQPDGRIARISGLMLIPAAIFLLARYQVIASQTAQETFSILDNFMVEAGRADTLASAFMMCGRYLWTLLLPLSLVHDMGYQQMVPVSFGDWKALLGFLVYAGMFAWALFNLPKKHFLSFAILFYLITFSLFSNVLITIGTSYGERLLYAPSLGFAFILAYFLCKLLKVKDTDSIWNPGGKGSVLWGIAGLIMVLYAAKTITRNPAWFDSEALYKADIEKSPKGAKLNYHLALELTKKGVDEKTGAVTDSSWVLKGIERYSKAIELYPKYHDAYGSRGLAYFRLKKYDQAFDDYQKSLQYRPGDPKVLSNMGFIYFLRNQLDKAEEVYRQSIKSDPRFVDARRNLGAVLAMKKNFPGAIEQWEEALKYDPENVTLLNYIGLAYKDMGQPEKGKPYLDKAAQLGGK